MSDEIGQASSALGLSFGGKHLERVVSAIEEMRRNPRQNWTIKDIERICNQIGMTCGAPTRGSHHKVSSPLLMGPLTVPYNRPIKAIYIKRFADMAFAHIHAAMEKGDD